MPSYRMWQPNPGKVVHSRMKPVPRRISQVSGKPVICPHLHSLDTEEYCTSLGKSFLNVFSLKPMEGVNRQCSDLAGILCCKGALLIDLDDFGRLAKILTIVVRVLTVNFQKLAG